MRLLHLLLLHWDRRGGSHLRGLKLKCLLLCQPLLLLRKLLLLLLREQLLLVLLLLLSLVLSLVLESVLLLLPLHLHLRLLLLSCVLQEEEMLGVGVGLGHLLRLLLLLLRRHGLRCERGATAAHQHLCLHVLRELLLLLDRLGLHLLLLLLLLEWSLLHERRRRRQRRLHGLLLPLLGRSLSLELHQRVRGGGVGLWLGESVLHDRGTLLLFVEWSGRVGRAALLTRP